MHLFWKKILKSEFPICHLLWVLEVSQLPFLGTDTCYFIWLYPLLVGLFSSPVQTVCLHRTCYTLKSFTQPFHYWPYWLVRETSTWSKLGCPESSPGNLYSNCIKKGQFVFLLWCELQDIKRESCQHLCFYNIEVGVLQWQKINTQQEAETRSI